MLRQQTMRAMPRDGPRSVQAPAGSPVVDVLAAEVMRCPANGRHVDPQGGRRPELLQHVPSPATSAVERTSSFGLPSSSVDVARQGARRAGT